MHFPNIYRQWQPYNATVTHLIVFIKRQTKIFEKNIQMIYNTSFSSAFGFSPTIAFHRCELLQPKELAFTRKLIERFSSISDTLSALQRVQEQNKFSDESQKDSIVKKLPRLLRVETWNQTVGCSFLMIST